MTHEDTPNAATRAAMNEPRAGRARYATADELIDSLEGGEDRRCFTCDYWFVGRQILTTETRGWCLSLGSRVERSTADEGFDCKEWKLHI